MHRTRTCEVDVFWNLTLSFSPDVARAISNHGFPLTDKRKVEYVLTDVDSWT